MNSLKVVEGNDEETTKENYVVNYLKSLIALEAAIEPYAEQKKELRQEFVEQGWLSREEIWNAVKAFRLYKRGANMDDLNDMFETIEKQFGEKNV